MSQDEEDLLRQLDIRVRRSLSDDPDASTKILHLKKGPRAFKVVTLRSWVSPRSGEIKKREFRAQTFNRTKLRGFGEAERPWSCENEEVEALRTFLNAQLSESGNYRLVRSGTDIDLLIDQVRNREIAAGSIARLLEATRGVEGVVEALANSDYGSLLIEAVELHRRRQVLANLRAIVEDANSTEHHIQKVLAGQTWIFGGHYLGESHRRTMSPEDIIDIPLLRNDGSYHVVELKKANVPGMLMNPRSHPTVGPPVHEAMTQAANYLRTLDEDRSHNFAKYQVDCRRASATVLIGHSLFVRGFTANDITEALRTYNATISRIQVLTYDELILAAERALDLAEASEQFEVVPEQRTGETDWTDAPF